MFSSTRLTVTANGIRKRDPGATQPKGTASVSAGKVTSNSSGYFPYSNLNVSGGSSVNVVAGQGQGYYGTGGFLEGILPDMDEQRLLSFYRQIYYYDPVGGSAADMMAAFPFGDFTLTNTDPKSVGIYTDALARLNIRTNITNIALRYLVDGDFVGTLVYDKEAKNFADMIFHDKAYTEIVPSPYEGVGSTIYADSSAIFQRFLQNKRGLLRNLQSIYGTEAVRSFERGRVELDPVTTLHLARRGIENYRGGISIFKRLLPIYLLERQLYRGTLIEAGRRQRSTTHIMMGDENWEPNEDEMRATLSNMQATELEPMGAWVVTRNGVQVQDIRTAGDFWKWTDTAEVFTPMKLRALSISEAFLSGDAAYSNSESALVVFLENADNFRTEITQNLFHYRIFPSIAILNGLYKKDAEHVRKGATIEELLFNVNNHKNFDIPKLVWNKDLSGKDSTSRMELLEKLDEKGFPVTLKALASASGVSLDSLMGDTKEDIEIRKAIAEYKRERAAAEGGMGNAGGEGEQAAEDEFGGEYASMNHAVSLSPAQSLARRNFGERKITVKSKSGAVEHAVRDERSFKQEENMRIVKAMEKLADPSRREEVKRNLVRRFGTVPKIM